MPDTSQAARLDVEALTVRFGEVTAVDGLALGLEPGTFTSLLGPSGCGKSTALAVMAGLLRPTTGDVRLDGRSVMDVPPERRPIALVRQKPLLFPHLDVAGNVAFGLRMAKVARAETRDRVEEMLARVRLEGFGGRRPGQLSGGQEQRVALARALVRRPRVLLLDEPFSQLDADLRDEMRALVRDLHDEHDVTSLLVTHDREEAVDLGDRVVLMLEGRDAGSGTPQEVYTRPPTLAVADFLGFTARIPGRLVRGRFTADDGTVVLDAVGGPDCRRGLLVLRPEAVVLGSGPLLARVVATRFAGTHVVVDLVLPGGGDVQARVAVAQAPGAGAEITLDLPPDACTVLELT